MPVTWSQIYVQTEERKLGHKVVGRSKDFTNLLITFSDENYLQGI